MKFPSIETADGRRAYAFLALLGGAVVSTALTIWFIILLRHSAGFVFWLAIASELNTIICLTGMSALLVRRSYSISRDKLEINDRGEAFEGVSP